jgi:aminopeptidase N
VRQKGEVSVSFRHSFSVVLAIAALALVAAAPAAAVKYGKGSSGAGDPFFPQAGNGGYDVEHYDLTLEYDPEKAFLEGNAVIDASATQNLRRFNLDLRDFYDVSDVTVSDRRAKFKLRDEQELIIDLKKPWLRDGEEFTVEVAYAGTPEPIVDPDESIEGWVPTHDGAFVVNEPQGSPGWYPVNDVPTDKATYDFKVTVPEGHTVMANGDLVSHTTTGAGEVWRWSEDAPMAPYLATATNGVFETNFYSTASGLPMYDAVDPQTRERPSDPDPNPALAWDRLAAQEEILDYFTDLYGEYPFTTGGGIMDWAPNVFYSLESQSRANYWRVVGHSTVVHEIAHQWFGNAVTLSVWPDIWLNEGFATFSEWIYAEDHGGPTAAETFDELYAIPEDTPEGQDLWFPAPAALNDASELFHTPVYDRGAMTLQALREKVGDDTFFGILRAWYSENKYGNVTTADFIALSERESGQQLDGFFDAWLFEEGRPTSW